MTTSTSTSNMEQKKTFAAGEATQPLQLYRKPHDLEISDYNLDDKLAGMVYMGDGHRSGPVRDTVINTNKGMPEVYRIFPDQTTPLEPRWIRLWRDMNPMLSVERFGTLLDNGLFLTNNTGWPGRFNCLTGKDEGKKDPAFHAPLICGGALLKGVEREGKLFIENLRASDQAPSAEFVLARPWLWFYGTTIIPSGKINYIVRKGTDGNQQPVKVPFITKEPAWVPLNWLHKLPPGQVPTEATWMAERPI